MDRKLGGNQFASLPALKVIKYFINVVIKWPTFSVCLCIYQLWSELSNMLSPTARSVGRLQPCKPILCNNKKKNQDFKQNKAKIEPKKKKKKQRSKRRRRREKCKYLHCNETFLGKLRRDKLKWGQLVPKTLVRPASNDGITLLYFQVPPLSLPPSLPAHFLPSQTHKPHTNPQTLPHLVASLDRALWYGACTSSTHWS